MSIESDLGLGPTGQFPKGKLNEHDKGELRVAVGTEGEKVVIHFGTNLKWVALSPDQAIQFANVLLDRANKLKLGGSDNASGSEAGSPPGEDREGGS